MQKLTAFPASLFLTALAFALGGFGPATAQQVGQEVTLTGCLAQDDEEGEEVEYLLVGVAEAEGAPAAMDAAEIELVPGEGVNLAPHVGHTVEITGAVISDDDEDEDEGEMDEEEGEEEGEALDEDGDLHIRVTGMRHVAASCEGAA